MLHLPAELALAILAHLPLDSLALLHRVSRHWHEFIDTHRTTIYHNAAALHHLVPSLATPLDALGSFYSSRALVGVTTWKDLCRKRRQIAQSWAGAAPSTVAEYNGAGHAVHRIKVDEKAGFLLTTSSLGGLAVVDLGTHEPLWALSAHYVREYAHCEYGGGFVVFDRADGNKEVWRSRDDESNVEAAAEAERPEAWRVVTDSQPDTRQAQACADADADASTLGTSRGRFQPWAVLRPPVATRAFRLVYPILAAVALDHVYLWDVRNGELVQTITGIQLGGEDGNGAHGDGNGNGLVVWPYRHLGDINYVEVGERHVFICGIHALRVFSRETRRCVLDVPASQALYGRWRFSLDENVMYSQTAPDFALVPCGVKRVRHPELHGTIIDEFIAVHVSSCGAHLAALLASSRLIVLRDFERATTGEMSVYDLTLDIQLGSPRYSSKYLAFENGRIAVATRTGVFIVRPDLRSRTPGLTVHRIHVLGDRACLAAVSCLQVSDTGLFLNWDTTTPPRPDERADLAFHRSLRDDPVYASLSTGVRIVLVDLHALDDESEFSSVFSIDFAPT